jgi:hypothetical protein
MLLTNFLPNKGNGTFSIIAKVFDKEGNEVILGNKTIICDNINAVQPFGTLDTPASGEIISGSCFTNWGWALTPQPNTIPLDGSTIIVWVDGVPVGNPVYNKYREDIATLFPGYNNSNGAVGYFYLDTSKYENGVHTISWSVTDDAGNTDGIGSRYFTIQNAGNDNPASPAENQNLSYDNLDISDEYSIPLKISRFFNKDNPSETISAINNEIYVLDIKETEALKIESPPDWKIVSAHMIVGEQKKSLSPGAKIKEGKLYWTPLPGCLGVHKIRLVLQNPRKDLKGINLLVRISAKFLQIKTETRGRW